MVKKILLLIVMFWNLENFFDPFPPGGEKSWTWKKFTRKCNDIAKTITLIKEHHGLFPTIIGVCEAENYFVLQQLTHNTLLAPLNYKIIHCDSPDRRGIDAALLYRKDEFKPLTTRFYPIRIEWQPSVGMQNENGKLSEDIKKDSILQTRLLVYVKGIFRGLDTLHCFVAHWPSKLGGEKASLSRRMAASNLLKEVTDSILITNSNANIIVMGDFNDEADSLPLENLDNLVNMSLQGDKKQQRQYTYKYKESWSRIDHFLISENMFDEKPIKYLFCTPNSNTVFKHDFLLEKDALYLGYKIRRTFIGPRYNGGVSDHLPIVLKVFGYDF